MRYNLSEQTQADQAKEYLNQAIRNGWKIELIRKLPQRTTQQNSFFHLLLTYFGLQVGYTKNDPLTIDEAKIYIKRHMSDVFVYFKNDDPYIRSSADLNTEEMSLVIDRMYRMAADMGIVLPLVDNEANRSLMEKEIEKSKF